jgi:hypothetical protein
MGMEGTPFSRRGLPAGRRPMQLFPTEQQVMAQTCPKDKLCLRARGSYLNHRVEIRIFSTVWPVWDSIAEANGDVISSFVEAELVRIGDLREVDCRVCRRLSLPEDNVLSRRD